MPYRTATRLTDVRLIANNTKYLYCDNDTILPEGSTPSRWGRTARRFSTIDEKAVFLSTPEDEALVKVLLTKNDFVISIKASDYSSYQDVIEELLNDKMKGFDGSTERGSIGKFILKACINRKEKQEEYATWEMPLDKKIARVKERHGRDLVGQNLYLTYVPSDIALVLWNNHIGGSICYYEVEDSGSLNKIDLAQELKGVCSNFESLIQDGCITCENRSSCLNYLSQGQLDVDDFYKIRSLSAAKNILVKNNLNYVPPSVADVGYSVEGKLDFSAVNIASSDIKARVDAHNLKHQKLGEARQFYSDNCSNCYKTDICGTRGISLSKWENHSFVPYITKDFCTGAKVIRVSSGNIESHLTKVFTLLILNHGYNSAGEEIHMDEFSTTAKLAASNITSWIKNGSTLNRSASACIRYLDECPASYYPASVLPVEIEQALASLGLKDGYSFPKDWWSHAMTNRNWVDSRTEYYLDCFPGIPSTAKGGWVVMTLPSSHNRVKAIEGYSLWGSPVASSVDTTLYCNVYDLKVKDRKPLKRFCTIEDRIHLALSAVKMYVTPSSILYYGPFGGKRDYGPAALNSRFWKSKELATSRYYFNSTCSNPNDLSSDELLLDILRNIAAVPGAKSNMTSLRLLSSIGDIV